MVKRPTGSGGEPSSPNCGASAGVKARQLQFSVLFKSNTYVALKSRRSLLYQLVRGGNFYDVGLHCGPPQISIESGYLSLHRFEVVGFKFIGFLELRRLFRCLHFFHSNPVLTLLKVS